MLIIAYLCLKEHSYSLNTIVDVLKCYYDLVRIISSPLRSHLADKRMAQIFLIITFNKLILRLSKFYGIDYNNMNVILIWSESSLVHSDPILQTKEWLRFFRLLHLIN